MPGHVTHDRATWVLTAVGTPLAAWAGSYFLDEPVTLALLATGYATGGVSGLILTPDLDVDRGCYSYMRMRLIHPALGLLWQWYWTPYAKAFAHRGPSHWYVFGTLTRIIYGLPWLIPLLFTPWAFVLGWVTGLMAADAGHATLDHIDKMVGGRLN